MAETWSGYNTVDDLWQLIQPKYQGKSTWDETTSHTLDWITRQNNYIRRQIIARLKGAGIDPDELTSADEETLAPINNLWAAAIIDPSKAVIKTERGEVWDKRYKDMLNDFIDGKKAELSEDSSSSNNLFDNFGEAYGEFTTTELDPYFKKADEY